MLDIQVLASAVSIITAIVITNFWVYKKLHGDIMEVRSDIKNAHARIDSHIQASNAKFDAQGARIDAQGARIDNMYTIIMKMLSREQKQ